MKKPECEKCLLEGKLYSVSMFFSGTIIFMDWNLGYWNEKGEYVHNDNPNKTTYDYICSNGHTWSESN